MLLYQPWKLQRYLTSRGKSLETPGGWILTPVRCHISWALGPPFASSWKRIFKLLNVKENWLEVRTVWAGSIFLKKNYLPITDPWLRMRSKSSRGVPFPTTTTLKAAKFLESGNSSRINLIPWVTQANPLIFIVLCSPFAWPLRVNNPNTWGNPIYSGGPFIYNFLLLFLVFIMFLEYTLLL